MPEPDPILEERWSAERAFSVNPGTVAASLAVLALLGGALFRLWSREGRDRRFLGSPIDQVMGTPTGEDEAVPLGEGDFEAPVEFAPPEDVRPGQIGTLLDERANVIDVTATIVDLAGRGFLLIQEIPTPRLVLARPTGTSSGWRRARPNCSPTRGSSSTVSSETGTRSRSRSSRRRSRIGCTASSDPCTRMRCARSGSAPGPTTSARGGRGRGVAPGGRRRRPHVRPRSLDPLGARRDPRDRGRRRRSR